MAASADGEGEIIQYVPFISIVHPSFWHKFTKAKLDEDKLSQTSKTIFGRFTYSSDIIAAFDIDGMSFNKTPSEASFYINVEGTITNKNTIEEFRSINKAEYLNTIGEAHWARLKEKKWIANPTILNTFSILSFADLKKFRFYYWFAFPAPSQPLIYMKEKSRKISAHFSTKQLDDLLEGFKALSVEQKSFFALTKEEDTVIVKTLSSILESKEATAVEIDTSNTYFAFCDPSYGANPGWPLRLFLTVIVDHCPSLIGADIKVIGLRWHSVHGYTSSRMFSVTVPKDSEPVESAGWVGWERTSKGNLRPKLALMADSLDPIRLADATSDLNLKLMKWRLVPDMNIEAIKNTKCLLLGAGTLGCHVARNLLAWGFRNISLLDNGKVSYSNPTRQVLYNFQDCLEGGKFKAMQAAENLQRILPTVKSRGLVVQIPMPGHPVGESMMNETISAIDSITEAIASHDVIFLLLDSREARWLPTLIGALYGKIVINAALGFDSYLVMRHGVPSSGQEGPPVNSTWLSGGDLGCYFCNDVTAPGNSLKDRTLDQQCTVTRPGVAAIAGALAVEILVALLQHPLRVLAPALYNFNSDTEDKSPESEGILGPIPHSIRGFLHSYQSVSPTCAKFRQCIACSDLVIDTYKKEKIQFLLKVLNDANYLEEVTGLRELHLTAELTDILVLSDEDEDENNVTIP